MLKSKNGSIKYKSQSPTNLFLAPQVDVQYLNKNKKLIKIASPINSKTNQVSYSSRSSNSNSSLDGHQIKIPCP